jgi:hypothetical protein
MPSTAALSTMRARVRAITDQLESDFVTDAQIDDWINQGVKHVWQLLTTADPDRGTSQATINTTAGTELYVLPTDFMSLRGVDYPISGGDRFVTMEPYAFKERNQYQTRWAPVYRSPSKYRVLLGNREGTDARISFRPDPGTAAIVLWYVAVPPPLVADADRFDGIIGFEDYPVYWACIEVRAKAEEDDSSERMNLAAIEQKIQAEAGRRDRSGQQRIARVRNREHYHSNFPFEY